MSDAPKLPKARTDSSADNQEWMEQMKRTGDIFIGVVHSNHKIPAEIRSRAIFGIIEMYTRLLEEAAAAGKL